MTDPPPISSTTLSQKKEEEKKWHMTRDMWHVTFDTWHVTSDTWHVTRDTFGGWTFSWNFSFLALTVCDLWYYEYLEEKDDSISQWINYEAICRTAPATLGPSITLYIIIYIIYIIYLFFLFPLIYLVIPSTYRALLLTTCPWIIPS